MSREKSHQALRLSRSKNPADSGEGRCPSPAASLITYGILLFEVLTNLSDPAAGASPYVIMPYYQSTIVEKFAVLIFTGHRMRPRPQRGQGWRKGVGYFQKKMRFSTEQSF